MHFLLLKTIKLCFINYIICIALQKSCSCFFNLIGLYEKKVLHLLCQLQLLFGQHLYISFLLFWICPLEILLSFSLSQSFGVLMHNTLILHLKLQLFFSEQYCSTKTKLFIFFKLQHLLQEMASIIFFCKLKHTYLQIYK